MAGTATVTATEQEPHFDIPATCKAGVVLNPGPDFELTIEDVPVPEPAADEVLVRLNTTGLCYSDIHFMLNDLPVPSMSDFGVRSPGHEGAGVVVAKGASVKTLRLGQRVGLKPIWDVCSACELCWNGKEVYCPDAVYTGLTKSGSYQQYVTSPEKYTSLIPEGVSDAIAGPIMCSAATMVRALRESGLTAGQWACFPGGGGGVGIQGVQLARAMGLRPIVIDTGEEKRDLALNLGAEAFVDFKQYENVGEQVSKVCDGKGAHGVFVTAPSAYATAISLTGTRAAATVMCIGLPSNGSAFIGGDPTIFAMRGLTVKGSFVGSMHDVHLALDYAKRGALKQICQVWPLNRMPEAVRKLRESQVAGRIVVDFNQ